jgi:transcriptional regulator with XRE-family HTH domain
MDDLDRAIAERIAEDPSFADTLHDVREVHRILDALLARREELGLTQTEVARRMEVKQPTVSEFERESSDPRLSTIQRYARAVGLAARVSLEIQPVRGGEATGDA